MPMMVNPTVLPIFCEQAPAGAPIKGPTSSPNKKRARAQESVHYKSMASIMSLMLLYGFESPPHAERQLRNVFARWAGI